ncbi:MAG: methyltransferase domain-containing protein [Alphaproteobacteria bacterium]|nr:methyltransferase domain-containing protein [Alphaproteobacteria bacterium]
MASTTGGYVTDVDYVAEFYGDHAPAHMNMTAAAGGFKPRPLDQPFAWCDYGCGNGITANVLAAGFPEARFFGVDFLPAHILTAETLAMRGNVDNAKFICKGFAELKPDDLPPLDFAVMHGILSWIDEPTRIAVLDDAAKRLKPGGILFTGCNAMPGWAAKIPLRNMIYSLSKDSDHSLERARVGLAWMQKLKGAEVKYFRDHPALADAVDDMARLDLRYMAHEYFNQHLRAFYFAELRAMMEARGLKFAGSATVFLNMVDLAVPASLHDEFRTLSSRAELEAKRDFIRNETFRRDVWVKGDPVTNTDDWLALNVGEVYGSLKSLDRIDRSAVFGDVQFDFSGEPFDQVLAAVAAAGTLIAAMETIPGLDSMPPALRIEAARLLAAGGEVIPFARPTLAVSTGRQSKLAIPAINRGMIKELGLRQPRIPLAAVHAGTGIELPNIDAQLLLARVDKGHNNAVAATRQVLKAQAGDVVIGGKALSDAAIDKLLTDKLAELDASLPKLAEIGVIQVEG